MKIETRAVHAGRQPDSTTGAVAASLHLATTFERQADGSYPTGFEYSRDANPNRDALEACARELEGGAAAAAFASGSAATRAIFEALAPGDHVVAPQDLYWGIRVMLREHFAEWGLETTFVDMTDAAAVEGAVRANTKLILAETPSNPMIHRSLPPIPSLGWKIWRKVTHRPHPQLRHHHHHYWKICPTT